MYKHLLIISTLLLFSCIKKKSKKIGIEQPQAVLKVSSGLFSVGDKIFFSDGNDSYCSFTNSEEAEAYTKKKKTYFAVVPTETKPLDMTLSGNCLDTLLKD